MSSPRSVAARTRPGSAGAADPTRVRVEIQALRALAVALVIVYHYWPGVIRGGFVGVDVFFVISGYLITGHLARSANANFGTETLAFWARRARRLLPASLFVLLVTAVGIFLVVPRNLWQQFFSEIIASALYVQNWLLASNSVDYLAANNVASPVQHYWSLSVEEQFYLVWPLLVLGLLAVSRAGGRTRARTVLLAVLGAIAVLSFCYGVYLTATAPSVAYFATTSRVWEFSAGGVLAIAVPDGLSRLPTVRAALSWLGVAVIVASAVLYTGATPFPGVAAIVPVLGTAAVLVAASPEARLAPTRLYALRPVQYLGDISYSLYLWHFSLLILVGYALGTSNGLVFKLGVLVTALILAGLTKRFVEGPVRRTPRLTTRPPWRTLVLVPTSMVVVIAVAVSGWIAIQQSAAQTSQRAHALELSEPSCFGAAALAKPVHHCPSVPIADVVPQPAVADAGSMLGTRPGCLQSGTDPVPRPCVFGKATAKVRVALIGDSHAAEWFSAVVEIAKKAGWQLTTYVKSGCPFGIGKRVYAASHPGYLTACSAWNAALAKRLASGRPFALVITSGFENDSHFVDGSGQQSNTATISAYRAAWLPLIQKGTKLVVLHDTPNLGVPAERCITAHLSAPTQCNQPRARTYDRDDNLEAAANRTPGATPIDMYDYFCTGSVCPVIVGGVFVYRDGDHVTTTFSTSLAPWLLRAMSMAGVLPHG